MKPHDWRACKWNDDGQIIQSRCSQCDSVLDVPVGVSGYVNLNTIGMTLSEDVNAWGDRSIIKIEKATLSLQDAIAGLEDCDYMIVLRVMES
jgi:hypothetical protein